MIIFLNRQAKKKINTTQENQTHGKNRVLFSTVQKQPNYIRTKVWEQKYFQLSSTETHTKLYECRIKNSSSFLIPDHPSPNMPTRLKHSHSIYAGRTRSKTSQKPTKTLGTTYRSVSALNVTGQEEEDERGMYTMNNAWIEKLAIYDS